MAKRKNTSVAEAGQPQQPEDRRDDWDDESFEDAQDDDGEYDDEEDYDEGYDEEEPELEASVDPEVEREVEKARRNGSVKVVDKPGAGTKAKQRRKQRAERVEHVREPAPLERVPEETEADEFQGTSWEDGPSPLEMIGSKNDPYLRVERVESNDPSNGHEDGAEHVGYCGTVLHRPGFEAVIRRRWGGGKYKVSAWVNGKLIERPVIHPGPSKDPESEDTDEVGGQQLSSGYASVAGYPSTLYPGGGGYPGGGYPGAGYGGGSYPGGGYGGGGYPGGGYGGGGYGSYPHPAGGIGEAYRTARYTAEDDERSEALRNELDLLKQALAERDKMLEVERVRREAELKDAESRRMFDAMKAEMAQLKDALTKPQSSQLDKFMEMQLTLAQTKQKEESEWRQKQWDAERQAREEQARREEKERKERLEREERERKDRLEREDRERKEAAEQRKLEMDRMRMEADRSEKQMDKFVKLLVSGKTNPLDDLIKLKQIDGGGDLQKFRENVALMNEIKATLSPEAGEKSKLEQAKELIAGIGEVAGPVVGSLASAFGGNRQQQPQFVPNRQYAGALPYSPEEQAAYQQAYAQQMAEGESEEEEEEEEEEKIEGATPEQWGKIMETVVDSFKAGNKPAHTASHLLSCLKFDNALEALPGLANSTMSNLQLKVAGLQMKGIITDPRYASKLNDLASMFLDERGKAWITQFLAALKHFYEQIAAASARHAQQHASQRQKQPVQAVVTESVPEQPVAVEQASESQQD